VRWSGTRHTTALRRILTGVLRHRGGGAQALVRERLATSAGRTPDTVHGPAVAAAGTGICFLLRSGVLEGARRLGDGACAARNRPGRMVGREGAAFP
jgi:hypothetical protein